MMSLTSLEDTLPACAVAARRYESVSNADEGVVFVVDKNRAVCEAVGNLLTEAGHDVQTFCSSAEFIAFARPDRASCLVVGASIGGKAGLSLQRQLAYSQPEPAVIFITEPSVDAAIVVSAMKAGAVDVLFSPFSLQHLLAAVALGLEHDRVRRASRIRMSLTSQRYRALTPRERQVMELVTAGLMNKQVAYELNLSVISIKVHRGNLMKKMGVRTLPDLVRAAAVLEL